jgi:hypothetical protein
VNSSKDKPTHFLLTGSLIESALLLARVYAYILSESWGSLNEKPATTTVSDCEDINQDD